MGKGQIGGSLKVLTDLKLEDIVLAGVAKGPSRKAGLSEFLEDGTELCLDQHEPGLLFNSTTP